MRRILAALVFGLTLLPALTAGAGFIDGDDTPGRLDMDDAHVFRDGAGQGDEVRVKIQMLAGLGKRVIDDGGPNRFFLHFDTTGGPAAEYRGEVSTVNGRIQMTIRGQGETYGPIRARHPLATRLNITLPESQPYNPDASWRLWITSRFTNDGACATPCVDRYPNADLGSMSVPAADGS